DALAFRAQERMLERLSVELAMAAHRLQPRMAHRHEAAALADLALEEMRGGPDRRDRRPPTCGAELEGLRGEPRARRIGGDHQQARSVFEERDQPLLARMCRLGSGGELSHWMRRDRVQREQSSVGE